jgi:hypothetical protein
MIIFQAHGRLAPERITVGHKTRFLCQTAPSTPEQAIIPQKAVMKDALNEARCSNELLEHLEHLHETNDLFGNLAKSQSEGK